MLYDNREKQKELFEEFKTEEKGFRLFKGLIRPPCGRTFILQLTLEKIVFSSIGAILILIVSFCFGVERGKRNVNIERPIVVEATVKRQIQMPVAATNIVTKTSFAPRKGTIYTVIAASYKNKKTAANETSKIRQAGFPAYVKASGAYYLICVGDYTDKKGADSALAALKSRYGKDIYIKTRRVGK